MYALDCVRVCNACSVARARLRLTTRQTPERASRNNTGTLPYDSTHRAPRLSARSLPRTRTVAFPRGGDHHFVQSMSHRRHEVCNSLFVQVFDARNARRHTPGCLRKSSSVGNHATGDPETARLVEDLPVHLFDWNPQVQYYCAVSRRIFSRLMFSFLIR